MLFNDEIGKITRNINFFDSNSRSYEIDFTFTYTLLPIAEIYLSHHLENSYIFNIQSKNSILPY